jgi:uncharacterized membrane protein
MTADTTKTKIPRAPQRTMILAGIGLPFLASSVLGPWADALPPAAFGLAFLASLATPTPLLARFARRRAANNPERADRLTRPDVVRALTRLNTIWGLALIAEATLLLFLSNRVSASQYGAINTVLGFGVPALLGAATFAYVRHRRSATPATT